MRGKPLSNPRGSREPRLIPAHAGKTIRSHRPMTGGRAHPRACGENPDLVEEFRSEGGSSPRMRGKPVHGGENIVIRGLIPAHAGKTVALEVSRLEAGAHPRACGENGREGEYVRTVEGSSPRMRGKPGTPKLTAINDGLIPAHAGKTASLSCLMGLTRAHPRACGENQTHQLGWVLFAGSSPRMRGKPPPFDCDPPAPRLIPAHAGKTKSSRP